MHPEEAQHQIKHTNRPCFTLSFCSTASRWLNMTGTASNRGRGSSSSPRRLPTWSRRPRSNREFCTRRSKVRRTWWCLSHRPPGVFSYIHVRCLCYSLQVFRSVTWLMASSCSTSHVRTRNRRYVDTWYSADIWAFRKYPIVGDQIKTVKYVLILFFFERGRAIGSKFFFFQDHPE